MKREPAPLEDRAKLTIELTRDSVCLADDCDAPHQKIMELPSFADTETLVSNICTDYLPNVSGSGHSWDCLFNDKLIATIANHEVIPKVPEISFNESNTMFFKYHASNH
jgi:hypothetical protein